MANNINNITNDIDDIAVSSSFVCSPENCVTLLPHSKNSLKIIHLNIRSIGCDDNFGNFLILLERININFDILILSECWLSKCSHIPVMAGYLHTKSKHCNQNDGVVVYVKENLTCILDEPSLSDSNCIIIKFSSDLAICALYRSPSYKNIDNFLDSLDSTLASLRHFKSIALLGDLNINISPQQSDSKADGYLNLAASHAMLPAHVFPTRHGSCLDHVLLKTNTPAVTLVLDSFVTDHAPVVLCCELNSRLQINQRSSVFTDIPACIASLENFDFSHILNNLSAGMATSDLVGDLSSIVASNSRIVKTSSRRRTVKPWITRGLVRCIRNRDKLHRKSKKHPDNETLAITYRRYRNFCNKLLKRIKRDYEKTEFEKHKNNPKETWKLIKKISNLNTCPSSSSELLSLHACPGTSLKLVNEFFANIGKNMADKITSSNTSSHVPSFDGEEAQINSMALLDTDNKEIEYIIGELKTTSATGWDGIPTFIIKAAKKCLVPVLCHVLNLCLRSGHFPLVFKKALVHPIYKSGDRDSVTNYRPISVLPVLSKILEKILNNRLLSYLNSKNILASNQYGFRSGKSTEDAVLDLTGLIVKHLNANKKPIGIFLDLSKAFDTVSVPILLSKLENIGVRGIAWNMFHSYLNDRCQCVKVDRFSSDPVPISYGIPQGSVLGTTLFLIYINDLCRLKLVNSEIVTYADDTAIVVHGDTWDDARSHAESAMRVVMAWLVKNLLTLNLEKTKLITFAPLLSSQPGTTFTLQAHRCLRVDATCGCPVISREDSMKYLGVVVDSRLSWREHIQSLNTRTRKLIYIFKKLRSGAELSVLKTVYYALAQSITSYCITAWGATGKTQMLRLERTQRAVLKVMAAKPIRFPTIDLYKFWKVHSVRKLFVLNATMRKHSQVPYDPNLFRNRRRKDKVCETVSCRITLIGQHFDYLSSQLYNRVNKELNIYPLTYRECKFKLSQWLHSLTYNDVESLITA